MNNFVRCAFLMMRAGVVVSLTIWSPANAASIIGDLEPAPQTSESHIKIEKEMLIERGAPVDPRSIAITRDDGFVVAGSLGGNPAWATRIDSKGQAIWRYVMSSALGPGQTMQSEYVGVVQLPDDSTVLCGSGVITTESAVFRIQVGPVVSGRYWNKFIWLGALASI
jgi:hypothetical protein